MWNVVNQVRKCLAIEHTCHFTAPGRRFRYIARALLHLADLANVTDHPLIYSP